MSEIKHYGVKGQKWGVRRTPEQLGHDIRKLEERNKKLRDTVVNKHKTAAAKYKSKATDLNFKAAKKERFATSQSKLDKAQELKFKAAKIEKKAAKIEKKAAKAEAEIYKNEGLIASMKQTLKSMNNDTVNKGKQFIDDLADLDAMEKMDSAAEKVQKKYANEFKKAAAKTDKAKDAWAKAEREGADKETLEKLKKETYDAYDKENAIQEKIDKELKKIGW